MTTPGAEGAEKEVNKILQFKGLEPCCCEHLRKSIGGRPKCNTCNLEEEILLALQRRDELNKTLYDALAREKSKTVKMANAELRERIKELEAETDAQQRVLENKFPGIIPYGLAKEKIERLEAELAEAKARTENKWACGHHSYSCCGRCADDLEALVRKQGVVIENLKLVLKPFVENYDRYGKHSILSHGVYQTAKKALSQLEERKS